MAYREVLRSDLPEVFLNAQAEKQLPHRRELGDS